jgi:hypothetical protein
MDGKLNYPNQRSLRTASPPENRNVGAESSMTEIDKSIIEKFPYAVLRDYPVFPLSMSPGHINLGVVSELEENERQTLNFILCAEIHTSIMSLQEFDNLRLKHYGIGVTCGKCPHCGSIDIAEIIWNLGLDGDPRYGNPRYELADNYKDGRGHLDQQTEDPRWVCRKCDKLITWKDMKPQQ